MFDIPFPIIEDIKMDVAHAYGMVHPGAADTQAVRATFFIGSNRERRARLVHSSRKRPAQPVPQYVQNR